MALTTKLVMRQGQSLVMTPQLLQAIKLLQFSNMELASFVQDELERNPLLERADETGGANEPILIGESDTRLDADPSVGDGLNDAAEADWSSESFATDHASLEASLGTELHNSFDCRAQRRTGRNARLPGRSRSVGEFLDRVRRREPRRRGGQSRILHRVPPDAQRASGGTAPPRRDERPRPDDRPRHHRRDRRFRLPRGRPWRPRRAARDPASDRDGGADGDPDLRSRRHRRAQPRRMPAAAAARPQPARSGDGGSPRQPRLRRPARHGGAAQGLRRRRRGPHRNGGRDSSGSTPSPAAPSAPARSSRSCPTSTCARHRTVRG